MEDTEQRNGFAITPGAIAQGLILASLVGIGVALVDLVKSSSRQEVVNLQTSKDIGDLKSEIVHLRDQATNAALSAANAATAAATAAAAATASATSERHK